MEPKIDQLWEWDIDRKYVNIFVVKAITPSIHQIEVLCEIIEGPDAGQVFETDISSFNNANWRLISKG